MSDEMKLITEEEAKTLCPWLRNSRINIPLLSDWNDITRDSADWWIETKVGEKIAGFFGTQLSMHSEGNFPEYDIQFRDGTTCEIKCSSFENSKTLFIETHKEERNQRGVVQRKIPSGLSLSVADYYILLNPGRSKVGDQYKPVMKVRMFPTGLLRHLAHTTTETSIGMTGEKKSYGFNVDLHDPEQSDFCLGHYHYEPETKTVDLSSFVKYNKEIIKVSDAYRLRMQQ